MATLAMFKEQPYQVWKWYLYRMGVCAEAEPNPGHHAVAALDKSFPNNFKLITQNVDNLHLRAGSSLENTYQIHGNIFYARCLVDCGLGVVALPRGLKAKTKGEALSEVEKNLLLCPDCGNLLRPHVLWFDETYNEDQYRFHSSLEAASKTSLLITVGTSGGTNLPNQVAYLVFENGGVIIDINPERNPFAELAEKSKGGVFLRGSSASLLPDIVQYLTVES
jgi:NAD-dependent deacetylase